MNSLMGLLGPPLTCGWYASEPVWFDADGLPHWLPDFQRTLVQVQRQRDDLAAALEQIDRGQAVRRAVIAQLEKMRAPHAG